MEFITNNRKWKEFKIDDIFIINGGSHLLKSEMKKGETPFIGASDSNNGITNFVSNTNSSLDSDVLGVNWNGSVVYNFYHPYQAIFSGDVKRFKLKQIEGNKYIYLFLKTTILSQKLKYSYGYKFNENRMKKQVILLPITKKGEPNYEFIEAFMKQIEAKKISKYKNYISKRIEQVKDFKEVEPLNKKSWGEFFIEDIFYIKAGKRLTKADMIKGETPFIGASDSNNGITNFVSNTNSSLDYNILGVNYNGSVVENFYHPYKAIFSDDVKRLSLKEVEGNEFLYLFIKTMILKQKTKFQYAYKFNETRMLRQKILFPIDKKGKIDYDYMENYIKKIEYEKLRKYIEKKNNI